MVRNILVFYLQNWHNYKIINYTLGTNSPTTIGLLTLMCISIIISLSGVDVCFNSKDTIYSYSSNESVIG